MPFALVHGEALVTCATWALSEAGVLPVDVRTTAAGLAAAELPLVLHDALCPMTPPAFIAACVRRAVAEDAVVAGVRQVTDTVKALEGETLGETIDRAGLVRVVSPLVVPAARVPLVAELADPAVDLARLVEVLRTDGPVVLVEAPPEAMRVTCPDDIRVLEALTRSASRAGLLPGRGPAGT